jgi:hypothetical protein
MSEMNGQKDYSRYDAMRTEQLREILRKHAHGELEIMPDTEELFYIMAVLESREKEKPKSTEEAYETFVKHYAPKMAEKKPIPFTKSSMVAARWMKRVAVIAVIFATLTVAAVTAEAFVPDFWGKVGSWTKEFFHFEDVTNGLEVTEPDKENNAELNSLREALGQYGTVEKLMPNWIPQGYICVDLSANRSPKSLRITAIYERDGERLVIQIRQVFGQIPQQIEKSEDLIEIYSVDDTEYYILSNKQNLQAAWVVGEFECVIGGKITMEEMKRIIDSI